MKRYGQVLRVRPEKEAYYKELHANPWPGVLEIYLRDGYLYSYYEYVGDNYEKDMEKMAADPETQRWWAECNPCQQPVDSAKDGELWVEMEEVFHLD